MKNKAWGVLPLLLSAIVFPFRVANSADLIPVYLGVDGIDSDAEWCGLTEHLVESRIRLVARQYGVAVSRESRLLNINRPFFVFSSNLIADKNLDVCTGTLRFEVLGVTADDSNGAGMGWVKTAQLRKTVLSQQSSSVLIPRNTGRGLDFIENVIKGALGKIEY